MTAPCTSCGLDVILGALTLNLGTPKCATLTESSEVFCGPGGVLSVPREACALPIPIDDSQISINVTLTSPGESYTIADVDAAKIVIPANLSTCDIIATDLYVDYTSTILAITSALPQCLPIICTPPLPPAPVVVVEIFYEWRTNFGVWTGLFSDFVATSGVSSSNHHQHFVLQVDQAPGAAAATYEFRARFAIPAGSSGTIRLDLATILARARMIRLPSC